MEPRGEQGPRVTKTVPTSEVHRDMPSVRWISVSAHGAQFNRDASRARARPCACARGATSGMDLDFGDADRGRAIRHYLAEVGIEGASTARWDSPFDFPTQALLYLPQSMPSPYDAGFAQKVAEAAWPLVRANGGRAFLLCTTLRAVDKVAERLRQLMALDDSNCRCWFRARARGAP